MGFGDDDEVQQAAVPVFVRVGLTSSAQLLLGRRKSFDGGGRFSWLGAGVRW